MARNIAGYISNLGKSVSYSAIDKVKKIAPNTTEFVDTNADLFKSMYSNIRDYKGSYTRGMSIIKKSKIYEAADVGMKAIFEDIKTGKFYNKEREDKIAAKIMGFGESGELDGGFGSFDMGDDIEIDDDFGSFSEEDFSTGEKVIAASIIDSTRSNAEMISMSVAKSAQHISETQKSATHLLYTQNMQAYNVFNSNLSTMNANISNILNFSTSTLQTLAENATTYYTKTTELLENQNQILQKILENTTPKQEQKSDSKKRITFDDVVSGSGIPDVKQYLNVIKNNIAGELGATGSMNSMFGEDSNLLLSFVSSPLKFIPDMITNKLVPKAVEKAFGEFDKSLSGFFGSLISKFNTMANDDDNIISSTIGKIFGIKNNVKSSLDTSNYNKGKVDWDGKSRKALVEVIPIQLAKIVSLLSGKPEKVYDYDKGAFIDSTEIKNTIKNIRKDNIKRATFDMREVFNEYMKNLTFSSLEEKESLQEDIDTFFERMYSSGEIFNMFGKNSKDAYLDYGIDSKSYTLIKTMFKNADKYLQHGINKDIIEYRDRENKDMINLEKQGESIFQYMYNNSNLGEFVTDNNKKSKGGLLRVGLLDVKDNRGKNIFFYLQNIYKELSFIRRYGNNGGNSHIPTTISTSFDSYTVKEDYSLEDIIIPDSSAKSKATKEREERERKREAFEKEEELRRQKNQLLINPFDIDNEKELENRFSTSIKLNKLENDIKEKDKKKKTFLEKLIDAENVTDKTKVVIDSLDRITKKPMSFIVNTLNKVDQRMYEVIYGKEGEKGDAKGFIDVMILKLKSTFNRFNIWLDEEILKPLKDKLEIENLSDLGKKLLGAFGVDVDEIKRSIEKNLSGEDSFIGSIKKSIKNIFKGTFNTVKTSMKDAYGPLFGRVRNYINPKSELFNDLDNDNIDSTNIDWTNELARLKEKERQQNLPGFIDNSFNNNKLRRSQNFYNGFDFSLEKESKERKLKYLDADIKYLEGLSNPSEVDKQELKNLIIQKNRIITSDKLKEAREFGKISVNEDYFNKPKKTSAELYQMFPGLVNSPEIGARVEEYNQNISNKVFDSIHTKVTEGIEYLKSMKESLVQIVQSINPRSNNTKGFTKPSVFNTISTPFSSNPLLKEEQMAIDSFAKELGGIISGSISNYMRGNTKPYADGGYVEKAQVATIGRGELVLSKEDTENLLSIYSNLMDGLKDGKAKSLLAKRFYGSKLKNIDKKMGGLDLENMLYKDETLANKYESLSYSSKYDMYKILEAVKTQLKEERTMQLDDKGVPVDPIKKAAFEEAKPFIQKVGEEFTKGVSSVNEVLFGQSEKANKESFGLFMDDLTTNISKYAPEAIGSGLLGAGVSLVTGALGGPLLGAAVGAGISLTKNSEKAQDWIFGQKDQEGNRKGGIVPSKFIDKMSKLIPDLKTYGIAGLATGLMPMIPFGPLGGLILGSGVAFAKRNQAVQDFLFGEQDGLFKPETKQKLKKMLPKTALGVGTSLMFGPFGFLGNALLGAGAGMLSSTDTFHEIVFGIRDRKGVYQGGILPTIRDTMVNPIKNYMNGLGQRVNDFLKEKIFAPLQSAFDPIKKDIQLMFKSIGNTVKDVLNNLFESSFGVPFNKLIEDVTKKVANTLGAIFNPLKNFAKKMISLPFGLVGAYGKSRRKSHIRNGNADYMTAEERMKFRQENNIYSLGLFGKDKYFAEDQAMSFMDDESIEGVIERLQNIKNDEKQNLKNRKEIAKDMAKDIIPHFNHKESTNIMKAIRDGNFRDVANYINKNPKFDKKTRRSLIRSLYKKNYEFEQREKKKQEDINNKDSIFEKLKEQGLNINDNNIDNYIEMLTTEKKARGKDKVEESVEEKQLVLEEKNHSEIVDLFREVIYILKGNNSMDYDPTQKPEKEYEINDGSGVVKKIRKLSSKKLKMKTNIVQKIDDDGTVRKYKYDQDGNLVIDKSDPTTVKELKQEQKEETARMTFYERMSNVFQEGKDRVGNLKETAKEKAKNAFSWLTDFFSGGGMFKAGLVLSAISNIPGASDLIVKMAQPLVSVGVKLISNVIPMIAEVIKNMLPELKDMFFNIANSTAKAVGYEDAGDMSGEAVKIGAKQTLKGKSGIGRFIAGRATKGGFIAKTLKYPLKKIGEFQIKSANFFKNTKVKDLGSIIKNKFSFKKTASEVVEGVTENKSLIKSLVDSFKQFITKTLSNSKVIDLIGSTRAKEILDKFVPKIVKEITERAGKASAKVLTRVIGGISTGGLLTAALGVTDFVSGFMNAKNVLGIVQEPTFGMRVCAALIKTLIGFMGIAAIIPESVWVGAITDIILPMFGKEDSDLKKLREETNAIIEQQIAETGEEITVEEYNKNNKKGFFKTIADATKSALKTTGNFFSNIFSGKGKSETEDTKDYNNINYTSPVFTGKGPLSTKRYNPVKTYTGKGKSNNNQYTGKGASQEDIKYMELNSPIKKKVKAKDINKWVNPIVGKDGPFYDIGDKAIEASEKTGLDPRYLVAHAAWESAWGKSAIAREKNNYFGIQAYNASPGESAKTFSSGLEGFVEGAQWIKEHYTDVGQNTIHSMLYGGKAYAQYDDGTPNKEWMEGISNIMYNSNTINSGTINKDAKWDGTNVSGSSDSSASTTATSTSSDEATGGSIFNAFSELGEALSNDINRLFGFSNSSDGDNSGESDSSSSGSSAVSEGDFTSRAGNYTVKKLNDFTYFSQSENPWADYIYRPSGGGMFSDPTIRERGCGTTSAAMVIRQLTGNKDVDPASMADLSTDSGTSVEAGTAHGFFNIAGNKYGLNVTQTPITPSVLSTITKDTPMIINGTGGPDGSTPFYGGHFVVGVKGTKDSITVNDPFAQSASKTYKISEIAPYMEQGWRFTKGGGKGPSIDDKLKEKQIYGKGPTMNLPKTTNNNTNSNTSNNSKYEKILLSIVEILIKISDNSNYLSKIVDILSNALGVNISEETKQSIRTNSSGAKQGIVNVIKQSVSETNPDNEYLLNLLDSIATQ